MNITGDVLLASGVVAYLGAFDARYRKAIIQGWQKLCKEQKIPCSNEFSLTNILGDQVWYRGGQITSIIFHFIGATFIDLKFFKKVITMMIGHNSYGYLVFSVKLSQK